MTCPRKKNSPSVSPWLSAKSFPIKSKSQSYFLNRIETEDDLQNEQTCVQESCVTAGMAGENSSCCNRGIGELLLPKKTYGAWHSQLSKMKEASRNVVAELQGTR